MSYDLTTNVGKVRLVISDKDPANEVFTDAEITYFLTENGNSINLAAAEALESWAASYSASADTEKIGDYAYSQKIVANMLDLAKRLREKEAESPYLTWAEMNLIGETE